MQWWPSRAEGPRRRHVSHVEPIGLTPGTGLRGHSARPAFSGSAAHLWHDEPHSHTQANVWPSNWHCHAKQSYWLVNHFIAYRGVGTRRRVRVYSKVLTRLNRVASGFRELKSCHVFGPTHALRELSHHTSYWTPCLWSAAVFRWLAPWTGTYFVMLGFHLCLNYTCGVMPSQDLLDLSPASSHQGEWSLEWKLPSIYVHDSHAYFRAKYYAIPNHCQQWHSVTSVHRSNGKTV